MTGTHTTPDAEVWRRYVETHSAFIEASRALFAEGVDRVAIVREVLRTGREKYAVCKVLSGLKPSELMQLFDVLVNWSSTAHGSIHVFRDAILSLPRDWVLARIEDVAEPLLHDGTYDEYRRFLELYLELDRDMTERLAHRAAEHPDADIREAGEEFLEILKSRQVPCAKSGFPVTMSSPRTDPAEQKKTG